MGPIADVLSFLCHVTKPQRQSTQNGNNPVKMAYYLYIFKENDVVLHAMEQVCMIFLAATRGCQRKTLLSQNKRLESQFKRLWLGKDPNKIEVQF